MAFWPFDPTSALQSRVRPAPPELTQYLAAANVLQGFAGRPSAVEVAPDLKRDFDRAISELPASVRLVVAQHLIGVFLVRDLGTTGFTDMAAPSGIRGQSGYIVIDVGVFQNRNANAWATWKERSPFINDGVTTLDARVEGAAYDDRAHAIQYILLHEFGHVVSIGRKLHPPWNEALPRDHSLEEFPFAHLSWRIAPSGDKFVSLFDDTFSERSSISFYRAPKLSAAQMVNTYEGLAATNYVTLYGATSPGDDFAEAFANYVHVVLMKRPFSITLLRDGKQLADYESCWHSERCAAKRKIIEDLLASGPR